MPCDGIQLQLCGSVRRDLYLWSLGNVGKLQEDVTLAIIFMMNGCFVPAIL